MILKLDVENEMFIEAFKLFKWWKKNFFFLENFIWAVNVLKIVQNFETKVGNSTNNSNEL